MPVLVKYNDNYADEFDVEGFSIYESEQEFESSMNEVLCDYFGCEDDELEQYKQDDDFDYSVCIGTNESIEYDSFREFRDHFTITEITDVERDTIVKLFGGSGGMFPIW